MDSFFGIGAPELLVILLLAGIVMGPKRIQQVAFWLGKITAQLQSVSRGFARQLNAELAAVDEDGDLTDAWKEVQDLRRQLKDLKTEITAVATQPMAEGKKAVNEARQTVENSIRPPQLKQPKTSPPPEAAPADNGQIDDLQRQIDDLPGQPDSLPRPLEVSDDPE